MARVAFIMDRVFRKFGLSGKSFIPMLIGSGCGVPGVMASRTIESDRDRKMTIMTTTFIPCGAKLPIIALIAGISLADSWQRIKKYVGAWLVFHQKSWYDHHVINHHLMVLDELRMDRCRLWYVKFRWT